MAGKIRGYGSRRITVATRFNGVVTRLILYYPGGIPLIFSLSWLVAALAVTLATTLQAVTGFGATLILVPLLVLAYNATLP